MKEPETSSPKYRLCDASLESRGKPRAIPVSAAVKISRSIVVGDVRLHGRANQNGKLRNQLLQVNPNRIRERLRLFLFPGARHFCFRARIVEISVHRSAAETSLEEPSVAGSAAPQWVPVPAQSPKSLDKCYGSWDLSPLS